VALSVWFQASQLTGTTLFVIFENANNHQGFQAQQRLESKV
jgi:hypothetical protein